MDSSFGTRLRMHRERQQVPLSAIADQTKIKASLLDGLERDDLSRWPGGIFRRSYVRAYAVAIGLEPDSVVREFLARYPDPDGEVPVIEAVARAAEHDPNRRPPTRLGNLISSAIGALPALRTGARPDPPRSGTRHMEYGGLNLRADGTEVLDWPEPAAPEPLESGSPGASAADVPLDAAADASLRPVPTDTTADLFGSVALHAASAADEKPVPGAAATDPEPLVHLDRLAALCTRLSRATDASQIAPVLGDVARMLDAVGLMLWTWNAETGRLAAAIVHGYTDDIVAQLPGVAPDEDNAIAWAFRSEETRTISGTDLATGALAVPLMCPGGCTGVLALELRYGHEQHETVRAVAEILTAQLSALVGHPPATEA